VYGPDGIWAIEVKHSANVQPADLSGLRAIREDYPACRTLLLYRGGEKFVRNGVTVLPCSEFLAALRPGRPLWSP